MARKSLTTWMKDAAAQEVELGVRAQGRARWTNDFTHYDCVSSTCSLAEGLLGFTGNSVSGAGISTMRHARCIGRRGRIIVQPAIWISTHGPGPIRLVPVAANLI